MQRSATDTAQIIATTSRLSFNGEDVSLLKAHLSYLSKLGMEVMLADHCRDEMAFFQSLKEGMIPLRSREIATDFMFVHLDAGRGFFSGQKSKVQVFVGPAYRDRYLVGPTFGNLMAALGGIELAYEEVGFR